MQITQPEKKRTEVKSQKDKILEFLEFNRSITALDALESFGCFRLASRISELKEEGHNITSEKWRTPKGAVISRYSLKTEATQLTLL